MSDGAKKKEGRQVGEKINVKSWKESTWNRQAQMVRKQNYSK